MPAWARQGYLPRDYEVLSSAYGCEADLRAPAWRHGGRRCGAEPPLRWQAGAQSRGAGAFSCAMSRVKTAFSLWTAAHGLGCRYIARRTYAEAQAADTPELYQQSCPAYITL